MRPSKKHYRVEVEWMDSTILPGGWRTIGDALSSRKAVECNSVGFVLADDKKGVVVASCVHGNEVAGVTIIPRGQVKKVRRLR